MTFKKKFKSILKELYNTTESISFFLCEEPIPTMFHITYDEPVQLKSLAVKKGNNWVQEVNIYSIPQDTFLSLFANKVFLPLPYNPKDPYKYTDILTASPLSNPRTPIIFDNLFSSVNYNAIDVRTLNGR